MKLVVITGPHAVGKMTVGQELAGITGLKLLHNHMTIELVNNFFDVFSTTEGRRLNSLFKREIIEAVAKSNLPGLIHTCMFAFDEPDSFESIYSVKLFKENGSEIYAVELFADFEVRIERNKTDNRLLHKPSKRNILKSEEVFRSLEANHRFNSNGLEIPYSNYIKIDNTHLSPKKTALKIKEAFAL